MNLFLKYTFIFVIKILFNQVYAFLDYSTFKLLKNELDGNNFNTNQVKFYSDLFMNDTKYLYFSESERMRLKSLCKEMFEFGYDNYMKYAFPFDELDPIHCLGRGPDREHPENININDVLGDYILTLVDSLDTLAVLGNSTEFKKATKIVA